MIIGINYAPEMISTSVYTTGLAEMLASAGHKVEVITALPYFPNWKVFSGYSKFRYFNENPSENLHVLHCPLYVPSNPTGLLRILHHASFALSSFPRAISWAFRNRPDIVFVIAPSLVSAPVGWLSAKICGAKTWLHIQDFEVEAAFATGLIREESKLGWLAKKFELWVLKKFDRISSISEPMILKLIQKGVLSDAVFELRNWADLDHISPLTEKSPMRDILGIETPYVVLYSGNLANKQGLEIIPDVARRLIDRKDLTFVICGEGPFLTKLRHLSIGLSNVRIFSLQPLEKFNDTLGMATVHILPQIAGAADLVLPSKLTNMLASGRPIIVTAEVDTALAKEVEGCGITVIPGDADALKNAIISLLDSENDREKMGVSAREAAVIRWDKKSIFKKLEEELTKIAY